MAITDYLRDAGRELYAVVRASSPTHEHLRSRLVVALVCTVVVDAIGSTIMFFAERTAAGSQIHTVGDAVFWTSAQLLTISSSMPNPVSAVGRVVDIGLELFAITVVTAMAGSFGAFFHRRGLEKNPLSGRADTAPTQHADGEAS